MPRAVSLRTAACAALAIAVATPTRAHADDEARAAAVMTRGVELLEAGDAAGAEARFRVVIALVPGKGAPHYFLARALAEQDNCQEAIEHLEKYLAQSFERRFIVETTELMQTCLEVIAEAKRPVAPPPEPLGAPPPRPRRERAAPNRPVRFAAWTTLGAGALCAALGAHYALDARALGNEISGRRDAWTDAALASLPDAMDSRDRARTRAIGLLSVGGALAVTGAALYLHSRGEMTDVVVTPAATGDTAAVVVMGTF